MSVVVDEASVKRDARPACATDPELFFPARGESPEPALRVCAACSLREPCLAAALRRRGTPGVWGGTTERDRRRIRRERRETSRS